MNLRGNTAGSWTDYEADEAAAIELYNTTVARLEGELEALRTDETILVKHIDEMELCVQTQDAVYDDAVAKFERNTELLGHAEDTCADWFAKYDSEKEARADELSLIADVKAICEKRFGAMQGAAAERADQFDYEWDPYANQYVYKAQEENFAHAETSYNESGATGAGYERDTTLEKF